MPIKDYLVPFFSITMIIAVVGWLIYMVFWIMKKLLVFRWFAQRRRKKIMQNYEFEDSILDIAFPLLLWDYYDVKRYLRYRPIEDKEKVLFTIDMLNELPIEEIKIFYERRYKQNGITGQSKEAGRTTQEDGKVGRESGNKKSDYYRDGKTSHYIN